jgi:hypothetical protein
MAVRGTLAFKSVEDLEAQIEAYFEGLKKTRKLSTRNGDGTVTAWEEEYEMPPTMAGLALSLDIDRKTLINYSDRQEFALVLARARSRIAQWVETALYTREASNGARFALEVNHGYGREEGADAGGSFIQQIVPPAQITQQRTAIPRWDDSED